MIRTRNVEPPLRVRVTLQGSEPPIWREVLVDRETTLTQLHVTCQILFGFLDYHLFEFEIGGIRYEDPDDEMEGEDASLTSLRELGLSPGDRFVYRYDLGDDWSFDVEVLRTEGLLECASLPFVVAGERAGPPEDSGGVAGLQEMLVVLADPTHPEYEELKQWVGEGYQPDRCDLRALNGFLALASGWGVLSAD